MASSNGKILVVENRSDQLDSLVKFFNLNGFTSYGALSLEAALVLVERHSFDVAVVDLMLQDEADGSGSNLLVEGTAVCEAIADCDEGTSILALSAQGSPTLSASLQKRVGLFSYIEKSDVTAKGLPFLGKFVTDAAAARKRDTAAFDIHRQLFGSAGESTASAGTRAITLLNNGYSLRDLEAALDRLSGQFQPLVNKVSEPVPLSESGGGEYLEAAFWSKGQGSAVLLQVGSSLPEIESGAVLSETSARGIMSRVISDSSNPDRSLFTGCIAR